MAESIVITASGKKERYRELFPQVEALLSSENDMTACMANIAAALHACFQFYWTGFYIVRGEELVLGPFQGPVACMRIKKGKGVCGTAWQKGQTIVVPDVDKFPGHIACSAASRSEIVVPVFDRKNNIVAVLDIDSERPENFNEDDSAAPQRVSDVDLGTLALRGPMFRILVAATF